MGIDAIPLWAFFVGVILIVMASLEGGFKLGQFAHKRSADEKESPVSVMSGSILGLGAFVLAFTFGIVANRFDHRRELVREEANALRTAWLRSDFLPEPDRARAKETFRGYVDERLAFAQLDLDPEHVKSLHTAVAQCHRQLWETAAENARKDMNSDVAALYIESLNDVFAIHALRVSVGLQARIPTTIWWMLLVVTALGMISLGYQTRIADSKRSFAQPILAVSFALVIALVAELDRPDAGFIRVTQQPLIDLQSWMAERSDVSESEGSAPAA
jgi:hypothetical protein